MKAASPALIAMFASNADFEQFDLYTFTLTSGFVVRYATCSFDVVFGGHTWLCARSLGGIVIDEASDTSGPRAHWTSGFNTGTWSVNVMPRSGDVIGSLPWAPAVRAGILDEATVKVDRGYVAAWPTTPTLTLIPVGLVSVFSGRVAEIDFGRSVIQINMNDPRELLDTSIPRNLFTAACRYALFSPAPLCSLNKASFAVSGAVTGGVSLSGFATNLTQPDGWFSLGNIVFTSGQNNGLRMMPRSYASKAISLIAPMPFAVTVGDTFTAYPGCDKTTTTCANKFNNLVNFGGQPLIPVPETSL